MKRRKFSGKPASISGFAYEPPRTERARTGIIAGTSSLLRRDGMDAGERARIYAAFADASRRLASAMDAKAGFVFAVNGALLTFLWIGARMADVSSFTQWLAMGASFCSMLALLAALWVVVPRPSIDSARYTHGGARPVSHYGYVATRFVHALVYMTARSHEVRATFYSIGSLIVIGMAVATLVRAIGG